MPSLLGCSVTTRGAEAMVEAVVHHTSTEELGTGDVVGSSLIASSLWSATATLKIGRVVAFPRGRPKILALGLAWLQLTASLQNPLGLSLDAPKATDAGVHGTHFDQGARTKA